MLTKNNEKITFDLIDVHPIALSHRVMVHTKNQSLTNTRARGSPEAVSHIFGAVHLRIQSFNLFRSKF